MWVTPEQIERAKQIDLLTYLQEHEPNNLRRIGSSTYCTVEHDSLKISNGMWHWFSRHIGGKNALDYLMKVKGFSFPEAVSLLSEDTMYLLKPSGGPTRIVHEMEIPRLSPDFKRVKRYLMGRGIDEKLIDYFHSRGMILESAKYHNCIFIGNDKEGKPRYGSVRGIFSDFKRELDGSDKAYSFQLAPDVKNKPLHVFEGVIDLLSYITLESKSGREWQSEGYLSLGGVYETDNKQDIPIALNAYLENHPNVKTVILHLDNDDIGRKAAEQITRALKDNYEVINMPPKSGKDYNDYLQNEIRKRKEMSR